ncbi:uncharacterized protein LOC135818977 [Sycon ciliatum]|uniref:uncharacterized protein LOC135818977 n=1 Tax=Sycon ciliatum TaxID=27933 RepID=UPI0031F6F3DB
MESELSKKVCRFYLTGSCRFNKRCRNLHIDETEGTKELLEMVRNMPQSASAGSAARRPKIHLGSKKDTRSRRSSSDTKHRSVARKATFKKSCRPGKGTPSSATTATSTSASTQKEILPTPEVTKPEVPTPPVAVYVAPPTCGIEDLVEAMDIQEEEQTE